MCMIAPQQAIFVASVASKRLRSGLLAQILNPSPILSGPKAPLFGNRSTTSRPLNSVQFQLPAATSGVLSGAPRLYGTYGTRVGSPKSGPVSVL